MGLNNQSWEFHGQNSHILFLGIPRIFLRIPKSLLKGSFQIDLEFGSGGKPHDAMTKLYGRKQTLCVVSELLELLASLKIFSVFIWRHQNSNKETTNSSAILLSWVNTAAKHLNIIYKSFLFESVLRFAIEDGWISRLSRDVAFRWPSRKLLCGLKTFT